VYAVHYNTKKNNINNNNKIHLLNMAVTLNATVTAILNKRIYYY